MITIVTHCEDRKAMVQKLSEHLHTPAVYLRTPTYAFRIGEITVNRDTSVSGEGHLLLTAAECLLENGYIQELPPELTGQTNDAPPSSVLPVVTEAAEAQNDISTTALHIYEPDWHIPSLTNLVHLMYTRQSLINSMLQMDRLHIDDAFIEMLPNIRFHCTSDFETLIHDAIRDGLIEGFDINGGSVIVMLPYDPESVRWTYYSQLISACIRQAKISKHILPRKPSSKVDKYQANAWLNRLGFGGPAYKELRRTFMSHLPGYAAFKDEARMLKHKNKLNEQRKIKRQINEEAGTND